MEYDNGSGRKIAAAIAAAATGLGGLGFYALTPRVTERDAAYMTVRGKLVDSNVEPGLKFNEWLPHVDYTRLPKFLQTTTVSATAESNINIRTHERARVFGNFDIMFEIDNTDPNFGNIYTELKADEIEDIMPYIQKLAVPSIINVYKSVTSSKISAEGSEKSPAEESGVPTGNIAGLISLDSHLETGQRIRDEMQNVLNKEGYTYIKVKRVIPSGVGLSPDANRQLEEIVAEERKLDLLKVQGQVADSSLGITAKQCAVTAKALEMLREAGVPESQLIQAYYLQLLRDNDKVGEQFVPGPIPGTGVGAIPVQDVK